ncbi:gastrula zinc finger protein XlCGF49.1-like [Liolophura sinensis]|uniref:gastrula zinc finger protein XlCGF49.1-like n=1 Tax=Liolophura sinensis TaxID=3198878 RepID=UPI00315865C9
MAYGGGGGGRGGGRGRGGRGEGEASAKFTCRTCARRFSRRGNWMRHVQTQHAERERSPFNCCACARTFSRWDAWLRHEEEEEEEEEEEGGLARLTCPTCGLTISRLSHLVRHQQRHEKQERVYICEGCDKTFYRLWHWPIHRRAEHGKESHTPTHTSFESAIPFVRENFMGNNSGPLVDTAIDGDQSLALYGSSKPTCLNGM